jgi:glycosyltransferase involved in cell wall biosynthesis
MTLFSILLPVYNAETTLQPCLESILADKGDDWDLHLIDDGSTDKSLDLGYAWARRDARVQITEAPHLGLVSALNTGLERCNGRWVVRMDADDLMAPGRLGGLRDAIGEEKQVDVWSGSVEIFPEHNLQKGLRYYIDWLNSLHTHREILRDLYVESPLVHPAVSFRKSMVLEIGGYRHGRFPEDYDLWLRLFEHGAIFGKVKEIVLSWRHHDARLTFKDPRYSPDAFRRLKVESLVRTRCGPDQPFFVAGAGRDGKRFARAMIEQSCKIAGWFELDPRKIGQKIHNAPVHSYDALPVLKAADLPHIFVAVGVKGARQIIRDLFLAHGLEETVDFTCVA